MRLTIATEPRGASYRSLLAVACQYCDQGLLVIRGSLEISAGGRKFLEELQTFAIGTEEVSEWPGTVLHGDRATAHRFKYNDSTMALLLANSDGLYDWQQPTLPEDLCLFSRADHAPWLVTIAHELDAFLDVRRDDLADTMKKIGDMKVIAEELPGRA